MSQVRKICMIGEFAVGKTSLVRRFVHSTFSDRYLTTVGVKVDTRELILPTGEPIKLVLWDIAGRSGLSTVEQSYLRGTAGYLLVADGTRADTLDAALKLDQQAREFVGEKPRRLLLNKCDLTDEWELGNTPLSLPQGLEPRECSAKLDQGVESAFISLASEMTRVER